MPRYSQSRAVVMSTHTVLVLATVRGQVYEVHFFFFLGVGLEWGWGCQESVLQGHPSWYFDHGQQAYPYLLVGVHGCFWVASFSCTQIGMYRRQNKTNPQCLTIFFRSLDSPHASELLPVFLSRVFRSNKWGGIGWNVSPLSCLELEAQ